MTEDTTIVTAPTTMTQAPVLSDLLEDFFMDPMMDLFDMDAADEAAAAAASVLMATKKDPTIAAVASADVPMVTEENGGGVSFADTPVTRLIDDVLAELVFDFNRAAKDGAQYNLVREDRVTWSWVADNSVPLLIQFQLEDANRGASSSSSSVPLLVRMELPGPCDMRLFFPTDARCSTNPKARLMRAVNMMFRECA